MLPEELFARLAPSVFVVEALSESGEIVAFGSGVVVWPSFVVTNEHVLGKRAESRVKHGKRSWLAQITHLHPEVDLCQLGVEGLCAPAVSLRGYASLAVGERVYAIGAPQGFDLTMSDGLISGLRKRRGIDVIQTTAPISSGSSGGGLFDGDGNLIGITTYSIEDGQSLNFAVPAERIYALQDHPFTGEAWHGSQRSDGDLGSEQVAHQLMEAGKHAAAIKVLLQAVKDSPKNEMIWLTLGICYQRVCLREEAVRAFREATILRGNLTDAWHWLGRALARLENFDEAIQAYKEAIHLRPDDAYTWVGLADAYRGAGLREEALAAYNEAIRLRPDYPGAYCRLGWFHLLETNYYAKAIEAFREAVRLDPDKPDFWNDLAIASYKQGDRKILFQVLTRLEELDPKMAREFRRDYLRHK